MLNTQKIIAMSSKASVCRVCLLSDETLNPLQMKCSENEYTFLEMLNACTHLEADVSDNLPQYICVFCAADLKVTFDFLVKASASDQILKGIVEEDNESKFFDAANEENEETMEEETLNIEQMSEYEYQVLTKETEPDQLDYEGDSDNNETIQCESLSTEYVDPKTGFDRKFEEFVEDELATENVYEDQPLDEGTQSSDVAFDCDAEEENPNSRTSNNSDQTSGHENVAVKECNKLVQCDFCGKTLKQMSLKHHVKRCKLDGKLHLCSSCPKAFTMRCDLKIHMKTHDAERERTCICTECGKGFFGKQSLKVHMIRHLGVKEYQCKICSKQFTTKKSLDVHEFTHNRQLGRFVCKHCDKRFPSKADLTVHERFHTGDYPYQCEYCDKSYAVKSHYNYHLAKHKGITYKCDQCDKEFMNRGSLTAHRFKHNERMPHECPICKKGFASPFKLNRHKSCHKPKENDE